MQSIWSTLVSHLRIKPPMRSCILHLHDHSGMHKYLPSIRAFTVDTNSSTEHVLNQVINLVKKVDRIDSTKVTGTADFQKDLSLDSLDKVELFMAFENEFSIEIPDAEADKLKCCADVAKYVISTCTTKET